ncbi:MAG: hypothetical protein M1818_008052 [Claussenomyces sp. TS43310]|nr:MAG: hypothetical protein M1818_008052 [Claussenomyces sp. TS43310]
MIQIRPRQIIILGIPLLLIFISAFSIRGGYHQQAYQAVHDAVSPPPPPPKEELPLPRQPLYKDTSSIGPPLQIVENFPFAAAASKGSDLPPIPSWNKPPVPHVPEQTPLLIGFTRNWRLLQQVVVSYLTAGWPPEDIYVVENTGTMNANAKGQLSLQNPFFLNHTRLHMFGVNVIATPTLLTFAQLQNFYVHTALEKNWDTFFWSHMDVTALSWEDRVPYQSLYNNAVTSLRIALAPDYAPDGHWSLVLFSYDHLTLVKTSAYVEVGAWDTMIPFYHSDCDFYQRLSMAGYKGDSKPIADLWDVASTLDDLEVLYRRTSSPPPSFTDPNKPEDENARRSLDSRKTEDWPEDTLNSSTYYAIKQVFDAMQNSKLNAAGGRNLWQARQSGGQGEPFYRDPQGFEQAILMTIEHGRAVFAEKWGHRDCNIVDSGLRPDDAWQVEHDWDWYDKHPDQIPSPPKEEDN